MEPTPAWWVLTYLNNDRTWTTLTTVSETNHPAHLFMAWATWKPARQPIYRTIRGKRILCGYNYIWDTPTITEQIQPLDTFEHLFRLPDLDPLDDIWYFLFSTRKLYERRCQGPLIHVPHPIRGQPCYYVYLASREKGIFRTLTFSGPGTLQPYWSPDNDGLLSLQISQATIDPFDRYRRRFLIAGPHLYLHFNIVPFEPAISTTILTHPQALALTGAGDGDILWVDPNSHHQGMLHVLWRTLPAPCSFWHLRTLDHGEHWTAHLIHAETGSPNAGNIHAGIAQGTSPHPAGDVVYAAINLGAFDDPCLARSIDQGATWTTLPTPITAHGPFRPRLYVDPANQAVVYLGSHSAWEELWRTEDHGDSWERVDRGAHTGITLPASTLRAQPSRPELLRHLKNAFITLSRDYAASWTRGPGMAEWTNTFRFTDANPNLLYLAKARSGVAPPPDTRPHVIFVTVDEGATIWGKSGANCHLDDGGGDSIPYNCGGAANDGILPIL